MTSLIIFIQLLFPPSHTTDDTWDCYRNSGGTQVCEREVYPCHYERDASECTIRVVSK